MLCRQNRRKNVLYRLPPNVIVCLSRVALGVLSFIKCGTLLARHRSCKNNRNSGFGFGGSRLAQRYFSVRVFPERPRSIAPYPI